MWIDLWTSLRPAIDIFFAQTYSPSGFLEQKTMEMGVAAEAIHRTLLDHDWIDQADFDALLQQMTAELSPAYRKRIRENFHNRPNFGERMTELLQFPDQTAVDKVIADRGAWSYELKHRRNGMAHALTPLSRLKDRATIRMVLLIKQTKMLITLVLMQKLGIAGERQQEYVERDDELRSYLRPVAAGKRPRVVLWRFSNVCTRGRTHGRKDSSLPHLPRANACQHAGQTH